MRNQLIALAKENHIDEIRFVDAEPLTDVHLGNAANFRGRQAKELMPTAKSILIAAIYIGKFVAPEQKEHARIGRLALSGLGANIIEPLRPLAAYLESLGYAAKIEDDTLGQVELPLKGAAVKAGLGWIGKNTLLLNEKYGSLLALGAIITDADLAETYPLAKNKCGRCTRCMAACPTSAIQTPQQMNRPLCMSHILDGGKPGLEVRNVNTHGYILGCDVCQNCCPWNRRHIKKPLNTPYGNLYLTSTETLLSYETLPYLTEAQYNHQFVPLLGISAVPYKTFKRNISLLKN